MHAGNIYPPDLRHRVWRFSLQRFDRNGEK